MIGVTTAMVAWLSRSLVITIASISSSQTLSASVDRAVATISIAWFSLSRSFSITMTPVNVVTIAVGFRMLVSIVSLMDIDISRPISSISWLSISLMVSSIASIAMVSLDSLRAPVIVAVASITIARISLSLMVTSIASIAM